MKNAQRELSRRRFLFAATAGTAATAAALVGHKAADESAPPDKNASGKSSGYQLTEHVENYYRTARV